MTFEPNKEYGRDVLERTVDLTAFDAQFIPIDDLPDDHRYFEYQAKVNAGGSRTEPVINRHRDQFGSEYRLSTEGPHPSKTLRESGDQDPLEYPQIVQTHLAALPINEESQVGKECVSVCGDRVGRHHSKNK